MVKETYFAAVRKNLLKEKESRAVQIKLRGLFPPIAEDTLRSWNLEVMEDLWILLFLTFPRVAYAREFLVNQSCKRLERLGP